MIMGWMADEYAQIVGQHEPAVITGKPISLGGSLGRGDATARGGYYLVRHLASDLQLGQTMRVAIQGFGNAGQHIARLLAADGHKIVAVSDSEGAVLSSAGLHVDLLLDVKANGKPVSSTVGTGGHERIGPDELIAVGCDLLVPAALENMIHEGNAASIKAKLVLELANGPVTPEADEILEKQGTVVLPDILANAGGVTVSYFEWVQNRQGFYWPVEDIHERLQTIMEREGREVWNVSRAKQVTMRTAAYVHALGPLAEAIEAHGIRPSSHREGRSIAIALIASSPSLPCGSGAQREPTARRWKDKPRLPGHGDAEGLPRPMPNP
jgi:glutamate dehydrogenase (NADP+)